MIAGIVANSCIDYPSHLSGVICTQGCNFNCFYCHNRELIAPSKGSVSIEKVLTFLTRRIGFLDGVVISGGEPTIHKELITLLRSLRELPFDIKVDTNGSNPTMILQMVQEKLFDYVALDIKSPSSRYGQFVQKENMAENVFKTLAILNESDVEWEVRTTLAPSLRAEDLLLIAKELPQYSKWYLQKYVIPPLWEKRNEKRIHSSCIDIEREKSLIASLRKIQPKLTVR